MKVKKNGWGTLEMFLLCGGLLIALLVAIYFISKLYGSFGISTQNKEYMDLEVKIEDAAKDYVDRNNIQIDGNYSISLSTLKESGDIKSFNDSLGNPCDGYVIVNKLNNRNFYNGYISCNNYQTEKN